MNRHFGEERGDAILREIALLMQDCFGRGNTYRYGGDEFMIVAPIKDEDELLATVRRFEKSMESLEEDGKRLLITCSFGYAYGLIGDEDELFEALRIADRKVYEAKRLGKARVIGTALDAENLALGYTAGKTVKSYEIDELTGLSNLTHFRTELEDVIADQRKGHAHENDHIALVYFNVQNFKRYNEQFGYSLAQYMQ